MCWLLQLAIVGVGLKKLAACGALGVKKKKQLAALWGLKKLAACDFV